MKKKILISLMGIMILGLTACGGNARTNTAETSENASTESATEQKSETVNTESVNTESVNTESVNTETVNTESGNQILVVYFSATGTTKGVAEKIATVTGADIYEIKAAKEYTSADLNYGDSNSRTSKEQNDASVRPEIGSETISLEGYNTIYIGYPIWWGEEPRIMDTFVESYDFGNIIMIPFCTSGSSSIGNSGNNLAKNAGSGKWLEGKRFSGSASESEIATWVGGLK